MANHARLPRSFKYANAQVIIFVMSGYVQVIADKGLIEALHVEARTLFGFYKIDLIICRNM